MIGAFGMTRELRLIEIHIAQVARRIPLGLIVEVLRARYAVEATRGDRLRTHAVFSKLDDRDEAVTARAVPLLRAGVRLCAERRERAPARRRESDRNARTVVVERLHDVAGETLIAIDVAPWRFPRAEV